MSRKILSIMVLLSALVTVAAPVRASDTIDEALSWLKSQQQADGGFGTGFGEGSDLGATCDVLLAIAAAGQDPSQWISDEGRSALDYLYSQVSAGKPEALGLRAKVALALLATGQDPADLAGRDLIGQLNSAYDEETGSYGGNVFEQAMVMLALFNAGQPVPEKAAQFLLDHQTDDGAWALFGSTAAGAGDTNTTALVIQALLVTGHRNDIGEAFAYFRRVQNDDGGFPYQVPSEYGTDTDANSTAYVLQALLAADEPMGLWASTGTDPLGALIALQDPDTGAFFWQASVPSPNLIATAQAIPAIAGYTFVNLPRVSAAAASQAVAEPETALLPQSGGIVVQAMALTALGATALAIGILLYRRRGRSQA